MKIMNKNEKIELKKYVLANNLHILQRKVSKSLFYDENSIGVSKANDLVGNIMIHFIDVGQGDSIFIELPNEETLRAEIESQKAIFQIQNVGL